MGNQRDLGRAYQARWLSTGGAQAIPSADRALLLCNQRRSTAKFQRHVDSTKKSGRGLDAFCAVKESDSSTAF